MADGVTAIMCVWNEARMAPLALESLRDFVDEYVVVDAGSTDRTVDIIKQHAYEWDLNLQFYAKPGLKLREARLFAAEKANERWLLIADGDEVFHTDGPNAIGDVLPPLLADYPGHVLRFPMRYLYADLEHTHLNRVELPPHKTLYDSANGDLSPMAENRDLPAYSGGAHTVDRVIKFNVGVKTWRRMFLREKYWYEWSKRADSDLPIAEYARRELGVDDLGDCVEGFRERRLGSPNVVAYDAEEYGYVPKVIREYVDAGDLRGFNPGL